MDESGIVTGVGNLHDVFLNASLMKRLMDASPMPEPGDDRAERFMMADRGRLERCWVRDLYVFVEAWAAPKWQPVRDRIRQIAPDETQAVDQEFDRARESGHLDAMRAVRDYMSHRDRRDYWDDGRAAVAAAVAGSGGVVANSAIHAAISTMFLAFFRNRKGQQ